MSSTEIVPAYQLTSVGLVLPEELTEEEWTVLVGTLRQSTQAIGWAIGDLWAFGEQRNYGKATDFANALGISSSTLKTYGTVARSIPMSSRLDDVSFSHHQEVASLDPEKRDAILAQAAAEGLSKAEVRRLAKGLPAGVPDNGSAIEAEGREEARTPAQVGSSAPLDVTWEERVVDLLQSATAALSGSLDAMNRSEFRLGSDVAGAIVRQLNELDGFRDAVIDILEDEVGSLMHLPSKAGQ